MRKLAFNINPSPQRSKMLPANIKFCFENSADPEELPPFAVFIWIFTVCQNVLKFILRLSH